MELKSRQVQLLRSLSQSVGKGLPLADVMSEFGVSRRTVYYDISRINDWLTSAGLGSVSVEDQCLRAGGGFNGVRSKGCLGLLTRGTSPSQSAKAWPFYA